MISNVVLQDLLAYVSSKHSYTQRSSSEASSENEQYRIYRVGAASARHSSPHAVLRVVDITVLTGKYFGYFINFEF